MASPLGPHRLCPITLTGRSEAEKVTYSAQWFYWQLIRKHKEGRQLPSLFIT